MNTNGLVEKTPICELFDLEDRFIVIPHKFVKTKGHFNVNTE